MLIFIIGYMGSGKSILGRQLADRLGYRFLDMDEMIEIATGYSIPHYFEKFGEASFRKKEREMLLNHVEEKDCVIATGGGTPCFENNMELINSAGISVFIDTGFETIMKRLSGKIKDRPLLNKIPHEQLPAFIREHMLARMVFYNRANIIINGDLIDLEGLVRELK